MLLTIRTTHQPATDLGFLLHKNPSRAQSFEQSFGRAHVFYPEATADGCTVALLLDVDPIGLVRRRKGPSGEGGLLDQYVNDRPYVASSFLSVAISDVFRSAMSGRCKEKPELADTPIPLVAKLAVVPSKGGEEFLRRLFEPLGYLLTTTQHPLDERAPAGPSSRYFTVELSAIKRVSELLAHLYVLIPVLDDQKHYWVGDDEVEKLLRHGEGWLTSHPERDTIARRYLRHQRTLVDDAIERLTADDDAVAADEDDAAREEVQLERPLSLNEQRLATVLAVLKNSGASRVVDLGCGEGKLIKLLLDDRQFTDIVGMDVSYRTLETAKERLHLNRMPPKQRERIQLLHGSLMYRDSRLTGYDAAAVVEVIEHLDPPRLAAFERVVFEFARPTSVVVTTPNAEYNVNWETCRRVISVTRIIVSSGTALSSRRGALVWPTRQATPFDSRQSVRRIPSWARLRRWRSSRRSGRSDGSRIRRHRERGEWHWQADHDSRSVACRAHRFFWLRQVDVREKTLRSVRDAVVRFLS